MFVLADFLKYLSDKKNYWIEKNLDSQIYKYKKQIKKIHAEYEKVGIVCENILAASLFEEEIDFLIFPASVLESQVHREYASAFQNEIILEVKNEINAKHAKNFALSASMAHNFIGIDTDGSLCQRMGLGNTDVSLLIDNFTYMNNQTLNEYGNIYIKDETYKETDGNVLRNINSHIRDNFNKKR